MAAFCTQCKLELALDGLSDFFHYCGEGQTCSALCERCGWIQVNELGECVTNCAFHHAPANPAFNNAVEIEPTLPPGVELP